ncbi:terminase [Chitinophaga tropicalis]|uniref:Terminase n=1 Tax=Chitinophaga tropicalis TaxID=2683588 RepID=A0A7K1UBL0_9BACT|nr:terminase [Chitinophaga tropicalis]MVT11365.1 terminase [Chitinophaga tropicalis]
MAHLKRGDRRTKEEMQKDALAKYEELGNITLACKRAKVPRRTFYNWLDEEKDENKEFIKAFEVANELAVGILEAEAHRRAVTGLKKGVFYKGKKVATEQEYSDTLLIVLLKAHAPEKYKDRVANEHTGKGGKPIQKEVIHRVIFDDNAGG